MNFIENVFEPRRVFLVWQPPLNQRARSRRIVGEILRTPNLNDSVFRYLIDSDDFLIAQSEGFEGYPAFKITTAEHRQGVMDAFMRRLPPRNREDFSEYLSRHRIGEKTGLSDFALLAYTGAKLPSDGFEFNADFTEASPPIDLMIEVAGFRHNSEIPADELCLGEQVEFIPEQHNQYDKDAIEIRYRNRKIGYVSRVYSRAMREWLRRGFSVSGTIERVNGKPERPLVYVFAKIR